ncbi:MAG TPA: NfeD family protein [Hyphomicrobiaceae bacterium]|nr:NfeD family protein [Hyphomicrobiaceae bacterium]
MENIWPLLYSLGAWNWLILAVVLLALEIVTPGVNFLWFGLAAAVVGLLALGVGFTWPWQVLLFVALSVAVVLSVRRVVRPDVALSDQPDLNLRGRQYIGRALVVEQAIENGRGKVRVGDTLWSAEGPDAPAGARVTVTGTKGIVLLVRPAAA